MRRTLCSLLLSISVGTVPQVALAASTSPPDDHLYLRHRSQHVTIVHEGYQDGWRYGRPWVSHQSRLILYLTQGNERISDDHFIGLIERSKADPAFTAHVDSERSARRDWGIATLGSLMTLGIGAVLSASNGISLGGNTTLAPVPGVGTGIAVAGLCASILCGWNWANHVSRPLFSLPDCTEAIDAYNRQLDMRLNQDAKPNTSSL